MSELYEPTYVFWYHGQREDIHLAEYADRKTADEAIFDMPEGYTAVPIDGIADVSELKAAELVDFYNAVREPGEIAIIRFPYLREGRERLYTALPTAKKTPIPSRGEKAKAAGADAATDEAAEPVEESSETDHPTETEMSKATATKKKAKAVAKTKGTKTPVRKAAKPAKTAPKKVARGAAVPKAAATRKASNGHDTARAGSITAEVVRMMSRTNGASKQEILKRLQEMFPKREVVGMDNTVRGLASALGAKHGKKLHKEKDRNRGGIVYTLNA